MGEGMGLGTGGMAKGKGEKMGAQEREMYANPSNLHNTKPGTLVRQAKKKERKVSFLR